MCRRLAALLLCAVMSVPLATATAHGQDLPPGLGIELLEVAADLADDPRANIYITDRVDPGTTLQRRIAVSNGTDDPMPISMYGVAATVDDGWVLQDGRGGNDLADWISVDPDEMVLQPGERREVTATIAVPSDAGGGERYAAVMAETAGPEGQGDVRVVSRVGVRVYLAVGGAPGAVAGFEITSLTGGRDDEGVPYVLIAVDNVGDRAIDVSGDLRLDDGPGALTAGPFMVSLPRTIGPGDRGELLVPMDPALPDGPWTARADLRSGLLERQAEATITFPGDGEVGEAVAAMAIDETPELLPPWVIGGLVLAGLLALILLLWLLLRRRKRTPTDDSTTSPDGAPVPAEMMPPPTPAPTPAPEPAAAPPMPPPSSDPQRPASSPPVPQVPSAPRSGPRSAPVAPPPPGAG